MAYDSWENVGFKVIEKINAYEETFEEILNTLKDVKADVRATNTKMWVIGVGASVAVAILTKFLGL